MAALLQQGYAFQHAYRMIREDDLLLQKLARGEPLKELLIRGNRGAFYAHLAFFLDITSLAEAISASLSMADIGKRMRQSMIKQASYPLILFLFSFATLFLFTASIIPQLMQSFSFTTDMRFLSLLISLLQGIAYLVLLMLVMVCLLALAARYLPVLRMLLLERLRFTHLPQQYCSYLLAGYYAQMMRHGISTRQAFTFLTRWKEDSLLSRCANEIDQALRQGYDINEALKEQRWIDARFMQYWQIALHTQNMEEALIRYQRQQEEVWQRLLKRSALIIQICAYSFVACMVLLVYQIMLVPLQILEHM